MNQLKALYRSLSLAFVVALCASAVCTAQTPATGQSQQGKTEKTAAAAPDKDKSAATTAPTVEEELAKTPAGKTIIKFFAAVNSGDIKQMRAFHESNGGDTENADKDLNIYERTGGLKPHSLLAPPTKDKISLLVQTKKDTRWLAFEFTVGTEDPFPIRGINARPTEAPAN
jgi:hypothetical protein